MLDVTPLLGKDRADTAARRPAAEIRTGVRRAYRYQGVIGANSRTTAAPEGRDRADLRQAKLRRRPYQLSRPKAAVREGRLARQSFAFHEGCDARRSHAV